LTRIVEDLPDYVRLLCPDGSTTLSLARLDAVPSPTTSVHFECDDLDGTVTRLRQEGLDFSQEPTDMPYLWREARLEDPDGNPVFLFHAGENRLNPPWRINP
jgi:uncharacterized glyoxalase superfamily protein PhnB